MADIVFNIAKGRVNEFFERVNNNDPANSAIVFVVLQAAQADADLEDYDNLSLLLANAGNTEATFTNYQRQILDDTDLAAFAPDDSNNRGDSSIPEVRINSAGGAANNTLAKVVICYDPDTTGGDDTALIPLTAHDESRTTDGSDLIWNAGVVFRAT